MDQLPDIAERTIQYEKAYGFLMGQLENHLPRYLSYHNAAHTARVTAAAAELAAAEGLDENETLLLKTAALFHDAGFLHTYFNHEEASCIIARESLPNFGYAPAQIDAICKLIMVTKLPHTPQNKAEEILCDADLHYVGTEDYTTIAEDLFNEFKHQGLVKSRDRWNEQQVVFLKSHRFFTASAQGMYSDEKEGYLKVLERGIAGKGAPALPTVIADVLLMLAGVVVAGFALKGFLLPNHFFDGGVTGLSLLVHEFYHINLSLVIAALNLPLIVAGYFSVSKSFAYKTAVAVVLLGLCLIFFPYPVITSDKLLISIFGGVFLGLGIGLTMRAGCALDGIEVLALYTLKRTSFSITEIVLGINIIIFSIAAFKFGIETALYSVLTYFTASKMTDYVIEGIQAYTGVTIISAESEKIKYRLVNDLGRAITVYKGERGFLPGRYNVSADCDIIFTVVTRLELRKLKNLVQETDDKAFIIANTIRDASGGILNRRKAH